MRIEHLLFEKTDLVTPVLIDLTDRSLSCPNLENCRITIVSDFQLILLSDFHVIQVFIQLDELSAYILL